MEKWIMLFAFLPGGEHTYVYDTRKECEQGQKDISTELNKKGGLHYISICVPEKMYLEMNPVEKGETWATRSRR